MTDNYSLELRDIDESDAGQYSCQLDVFGHTQTVLHNLTVLGTILSAALYLHGIDGFFLFSTFCFTFLFYLFLNALQ